MFPDIKEINFFSKAALKVSSLLWCDFLTKSKSERDHLLYWRESLRIHMTKGKRTLGHGHFHQLKYCMNPSVHTRPFIPCNNTAKGLGVKSNYWTNEMTIWKRWRRWTPCVFTQKVVLSCDFLQCVGCNIL